MTAEITETPRSLDTLYDHAFTELADAYLEHVDAINWLHDEIIANIEDTHGRSLLLSPVYREPICRAVEGLLSSSGDLPDDVIKAIRVAFGDIVRQLDENPEYFRHMEELRVDALALGDNGKHEESLRKWLELHALDPTNPVVLSKLGCCELALGNYDSAIHYFRTVSDLRPNNMAVRFDLMQALSNKFKRMSDKQSPEAYQLMDELHVFILKKNPSDPMFNSTLMVVLANMGDFEGALHYSQCCSGFKYSTPDIVALHQQLHAICMIFAGMQRLEAATAEAGGMQFNAACRNFAETLDDLTAIIERLRQNMQ